MNIQKYHLIPVNMSKIHLSIHTYLILKQKINLPTRKEIYWNYSQTWSLKGTISPGGRKPKRSEKELIPYAFGGALSVSSFSSCVSELHWTFAAPATNTILLSSGWHARRREFFCTLSLSWALGTPAILDLWPHDAHSARRSRRAPGHGVLATVGASPTLAGEGLCLMEMKSEFRLCAPTMQLSHDENRTCFHLAGPDEEIAPRLQVSICRHDCVAKSIFKSL